MSLLSCNLDAGRDLRSGESGPCGRSFPPAPPTHVRVTAHLVLCDPGPPCAIVPGGARTSSGPRPSLMRHYRPGGSAPDPLSGRASPRGRGAKSTASPGSASRSRAPRQSRLRHPPSSPVAKGDGDAGSRGSHPADHHGNPGVADVGEPTHQRCSDWGGSQGSRWRVRGSTRLSAAKSPEFISSRVGGRPTPRAPRPPTPPRHR